MPAPADSPMCKDLYDKLVHLADCHDNNAENDVPLPHFNIILRNGHEIRNVRFIDGSNSLDDMSIDLEPVCVDDKGEWTVVSAEIAAMQTIFPNQSAGAGA